MGRSEKFEPATANLALRALAMACKVRKVDEDYPALKPIIDAIIFDNFSGELDQLTGDLAVKNADWVEPRGSLRDQLDAATNKIINLESQLVGAQIDGTKNRLLAERRVGEIEGLTRALGMFIENKLTGTP